MKSFLIILHLLTGSFYAFGHLANDAGEPLKIGKCYPSFPSGYFVMKKIDNQTYELRGNSMSPNAILKTRTITPKAMALLRKLGPLNMSLKFGGTKMMELENGFEAPVDLWEDCDLATASIIERKAVKNDSMEEDDYNNCTTACYQKFGSNKIEALPCYDSCEKDLELEAVKPSVDQKLRKSANSNGQGLLETEIDKGLAKKQSKLQTDVESWLETAREKFEEVCKESSQAECFLKAQEAVARGNRDEAMLLALHLCKMGEMGDAIDSKDPCSWHSFSGLESGEIKAALMEKICKEGNRQACVETVSLTGKEQRDKKSIIKRQFKVLKSLCDIDGFIPACGKAGGLAMSSKIKVEKKEAIRLLEKACEVNHPFYCSLLAIELDQNGESAKASKARAKACKLDSKNCK